MAHIDLIDFQQVESFNPNKVVKLRNAEKFLRVNQFEEGLWS